MTTDLLPLPPELAVETEPFSDFTLTDHLARPDADPSTLPLARWSIEDDGEADWAMRHVAVAQASLTQSRDQANAWRARIDQWEDDQAGRLQPRIAFFVGALEEFARRRREEDPRAKTLRLPSGAISSRSVPEKVVVENEPAVLEWARRSGHLDLIKVTESLDKSVLRKSVGWDGGMVLITSEDGAEVVPGCSVAPGHVVFTVKVGGA